MNLTQLYQLVIKLGAECDPRGAPGVKKALERTRKLYQKLTPKEKGEFDRERLKHPYDDTRVLNGRLSAPVKNCLVGIDIDAGEILLADRLKQKGKKIDLVISHHPSGRAYANFYNVMDMQADLLNKLGIPFSVAEKLISQRIKEVSRKVMSANHQRAVDCARLLEVSFICVHTPADNHAQEYLQNLINCKKPKTLGAIIEALKLEPEYQEALREKAGPAILIGSPGSRTGKIAVEMTGGTEGSRDVYDRLSQAGVGTIVAMHLSEEHFKKAKKAGINVVIAGHISSDNLGLNRLLDGVEKKAGLNIIEASGFRRFKRK